MRFVNIEGRSGLLADDRVYDLQELSGGTVKADPALVVRSQRLWDKALEVHARGAFSGGTPVAEVRLRPPMPNPRAVYAVGLNYQAHADETGKEKPELPGIFTKFPTSLTGPNDDVVLPIGRTAVDWEAELAFVMADSPRHVPAEDALDRVLGFCCAQDISERHVQYAAMGQFSMGKSYDTFCPMGPAIVTLDELATVADPADLRITCRVNGEVKQDARTSDLIFDIPALVAFISSVCTLRAGDLCLTGTPSGVGVMAGTFLGPGDVIETEIEGLGTMRNCCVAE